MSDYKRKITFQDKEDSTIINSESKYVLTAENINEIKEVVNNLSDELANRLRFNHIFKFTRFNVPNTLKDDCNYTFKFELSNDPSFSKNIRTITLKNDFSIFSIFENNKWVKLNSARTITKNDIDKVLKADISSIISDEEKYYFGRCKWINETSNEEDQWQGFALSIFEYNDKDFDKKLVKDLYIKGRTALNEKEIDIEYNVYIKDQNDNEIKISDNVTFKSLLGKSTFNKNKLSIGKFHNIDHDIIEASFTYNNIKYTTFLNILINPIILEKLEIEKEFNKIVKDKTYQFNVRAYWSNGTNKLVTSESLKTLILGKCELNENNILGKGNYDSFGPLTINYQDPDFPELEHLMTTTYLNYEVPKFKNFEIDFPLSLKGDDSDVLNYSVKVAYDNGTEKDITNDVSIKIVDCTEFTCQNGVITINANEMNTKKNVSLLFTYSEPDCNNLTYSEIINVLLDPKVLTDIDVEFIQNNENVFDTFENSSITYKIYGIYNDGSRQQITSNYDISLLTDSNCTINKSRKTITIGEHEFTNIAIFKISYTSNNVTLEKNRYLGINSISITKLTASSDIVSGDPNTEWETNYNSSKTIYFNGTMSNQTESNVTNNVTIRLASGNPNLINKIENNVISFNEPVLASEAVCFIGTYQNPKFASEIKSTHFVITVLKK
jgi:hypothetical protein